MLHGHEINTVTSLFADEAKLGGLLLFVAVYFDQLREGFQARRDRIDSTRSSWRLRVHQCRRLRVFMAWSLAVHHRTDGRLYTIQLTVNEVNEIA